MVIAYCARYLGVVLGPEAGEGWLGAPTDKCWAVARGWSSSGGGALRDVRAYGLYAVSILSFYLQHVYPTKGVQEREKAARRKGAAGPRELAT